MYYPSQELLKYPLLFPVPVGLSASEFAHGGVGYDRIHVAYHAPETSVRNLEVDGAFGGLEQVIPVFLAATAAVELL